MFMQMKSVNSEQLTVNRAFHPSPRCTLLFTFHCSLFTF
jgi:hypothetical protein